MYGILIVVILVLYILLKGTQKEEYTCKKGKCVQWKEECAKPQKIITLRGMPIPICPSGYAINSQNGFCRKGYNASQYKWCQRVACQDICPGSWFNVNTTYYGRNDGSTGISYPGVLVMKYPIKWKKGRLVYPIAVHEKDWPRWSCKILEIKLPNGRTILGHVVDLCRDSDCRGCCSKNISVQGSSTGFLVDIHVTGHGAAGYSDGIQVSKARVLGTLPFKSLPRHLLSTSVLDCGAKWP